MLESPSELDGPARLQLGVHMGREHVDHAEIARFADEQVNLKREDAAEFREQVGRLRERLEAYLKDHPDFALRKMLLSGSLAKGTALKSLNDIDVACYVSSERAPAAIPELIQFLAERLRNAFPNFKPEQVKPNEFSVTVTFVGSGLRVDVVPILYQGDAAWRGFLISQENGDRVLTSIPMHLEFTRKRKGANTVHYAQVVRLLKYWVAQRKQADDQFRLKSFMVELLVAHLADHGLKLNNYPEALASILAFIGRDGFRTAIFFSDYYDPRACPSSSQPIRIWDPVNATNNVARLYTASQTAAIVEAALDAGDAIDAALRAPTKGETIRHWQRVFGSAFSA